jgi:hypothetical protein
MAWPFEAEMHEIAQTSSEAALAGTFQRGTAEIYRRLATLRSLDGLPDLEAVLISLQSIPGKRRTDSEGGPRS